MYELLLSTVLQACRIPSEREILLVVAKCAEHQEELRGRIMMDCRRMYKCS